MNAPHRRALEHARDGAVINGVMVDPVDPLSVSIITRHSSTQAEYLHQLKEEAEILVTAGPFKGRAYKRLPQGGRVRVR